MKGWFIILLITSQLLFPSVVFTQRKEQPLLAMQASQEQPHAVPDQQALFEAQLKQQARETYMRTQAPHKAPANNTQLVTLDSFSTKSLSSFPRLNAIDTNFADDCAYCVTKESVFFPKASSADLVFRPRVSSGNYFTFTVLHQQINGQYIDPYPRILEVYYGGQIIKSETVRDTSTSFTLYGPFSGEVTVRLRWGGYADYAWSLKQVYFSQYADFSDIQTLNDYLYFPSSTQSLTFEFIGGEDTEMSFSAVSNNIDAAEFYIFVDGGYFGSSSSSSGTISYNAVISPSVLTWADRSVHYLTIQILSADEAWFITGLDFSYHALDVYYFWHPGNELDSATATYIESYYNRDGYERIDLINNGSITLYDGQSIDESKLKTLYDTYGIKSPKARNIFLVDYTQDSLGFTPHNFDLITGDYIFYSYATIGIQSIKDEFIWWCWSCSDTDKIKVSFMHELGHTLGINRYHNGVEYYDWGNQDTSVMNKLSANNIIGSPYYSYWYWTTGNWWDTRYSFTSKLYVGNGDPYYGIIVPKSIVDV